MSNFFGNRNKGNRLEDFGYADMVFATGDQDRLATLQSTLDSKNDEKVDAQNKLDTAKACVKDMTAKIKSEYDYVYGKDKLCKWHYSNDRCSNLRKDHINTHIKPLETKKLGCQGNVSTYTTRVSDLNLEIANITQEIATLLEAMELEAQATLTLAGQGKTPEQIKIEAQAKADAIAKDSQVESEIKERRSKSTKLIILAIVLTAVFLGGLYVFYRIKKKGK